MRCNNINNNKDITQDRAELGQAQIKLELELYLGWVSQ